MLALASVEYRQNEIEMQPVNLAALCLQVVTSFEQGANKKLKDKNIRLVHELLNVETVIEGDAFLLTQAIQNLLDNAIDFSPEYGVIKVAIESSSTHYIINIQDDGVGIPDYAAPRLFERFYSLPRPDTGQRSSGLGLSFVKEVALAHKGDITLTNQPGSGVLASLSIEK